MRRAVAAREAVALDEVQRLLDAGLAAMEETGPGSPPKVADIVARAGLSNQAFYRHFAGRDELVAAILERGAGRLVEFASRRMAAAASAELRVRAWVEAVLSQAEPHVAAPTRAVMWNFGHLPRPSVDHAATMAGASNALAHLLDDPVRELGSADVARDVAAISDVAHGRLQHHLWGAPPTTADVDHAVRFCLAGVTRADGTTEESEAGLSRAGTGARSRG